MSTRLLVPLIATVGVIMASYGGWSLAERERALKAEAERETGAYATALGVALEYAFADRELNDVENIIERVSLEPKIYGVVVYGPDGRALYAAAPVTTADALGPEAIEPVLRTGKVTTLDRPLRGRTVFSVIRPIRGGRGEVLGAFETVQPLAFLQAEIERTRFRLLFATLALMGALFLVIHWFVRRVVTRPLDRFLEAVRALREGDLAHRVQSGSASREVGALAHEFNGMAGHLQAARDALIRETEEKVGLERKLRETEKLAVIGQLAAGLAHEIGTPLNVVAGRAELLLRHESDPERQRKLRIILQQIERITGIVRSLLGFARRREPHPEPSDLGAILDGVLEFLDAEAARAQIRLERQGPKSAWCDVDPQLIHELLLNLLMNALQAVEAMAGEKRVVVRLLEARGPAAEPGGAWVIEIEDNGPGIAPGAMPHVFEPFYTTKPGGVGTGLGLAVARAIVEEHGGVIEARNIYDATDEDDAQAAEGALLRVTLPAGAPARTTGGEVAHA